MKTITKRLLAVAASGLLAVAISCTTTAAAATTTTLNFKEPEKGSTFTYVDVAPTAPKKHGSRPPSARATRSSSPTR